MAAIASTRTITGQPALVDFSRKEAWCHVNGDICVCTRPPGTNSYLNETDRIALAEGSQLKQVLVSLTGAVCDATKLKTTKLYPYIVNTTQLLCAFHA